MKLEPARERLRSRQEALGVQAKKSLGQNFLISDSVIGKILKATKDLKPGSILEVGPGMGALTDGLKQLGVPLRLIELDSVFAQYWRDDGQEVIETDALQWDWAQLSGEKPRVLVSNLPYQISSSLVVDRSLDDDPLAGMVLMFQKEVAQRMKATEKQGPYGFLSVLAQSFWKIDLLLEASSHDFLPPPKVASRVLVFQTKPSPVENKRDYLRFLKACFSQPRKYMASNLAGEYALPKEEVKSRLESWGFNPQTRAEQLSLQNFLEIYPHFKR
ncbi:MAG: ribosomal RNA small subunit methyltransferase A [Bdellovibrionaceae bacterium]|nr:ribosomal RNA small subunit methyltransferase A [Pseudobdellovibrionaceae bacterium]